MIEVKKVDNLENVVTENEPDFSTWEWLANFRTSRVLNIGYLGVVLVPIIAILIIEFKSISFLILDLLKNLPLLIDKQLDAEQLQQFLTFLNSSIEKLSAKAEEVKLPISLFFLLFGSVFLSIGHFLNQFFCPFIIKNSGSLSGYRKYIASTLTDFEVLAKENERRVREEVSKTLKKGSNLSDITVEQHEIAVSQIINSINAKKEVSDDFMSNYKNVWKEQNENNKWLRYFIVFCYGIAGIISLLLLLRQLCIVFESTFF